jgi:Holliday junction resolvase RusA-like endonuclease
MMLYVIPITPISWARPRYNGKTKIFFDKQVAEKEMYRACVRSMHKGAIVPFRDCPLELTVTFFMPLPIGEKTRKLRSEQHYVMSRPDLSNLIKFLEDAFNGILFEDDALISVIQAKKVYDIKPRVEFEIKPIKGPS